LQGQLSTCLGYAEREGFTVVKTYSDEGVSGQIVNRPEIQQAISDAQDGLYRHFIFDHWDRLGRTLETSKDLERGLTDAGVTLHPVRGGGEYDPEDDSQWLGASVQQVVSESERRGIMKRTLRGKRESAKAGSVIIGGQLPYGYDRDRPDPKGPTSLKPNAREAKIVGEIFERWINGDSLNAIADNLNRRGIKKRNWPNAKWSNRTVRTILTNEVYIGRWYYGRTRSRHPGRKLEDGKRNPRFQVERDEWIMVEVPPIVDEQTWAEAGVRVTANLKKYANNVKQTYLLRGRIVCAECGRNHIGRTHSPKEDFKYSYYIHNPKREGCSNKVSFRRDEFEYQAWLRLCAMHMWDRDRWIELIGVVDNQRTEIEVQIAECEKDLADLDIESENNRVDLRKRVITPENYTKNMEELSAERDALNLRIVRLSTQLNDPLYRELAIDPSEIEHEYREFAHPRRMDLESEHGRDTIRQYLELFNIRVEVRSSGDPIWHCEGFDDQNRYS